MGFVLLIFLFLQGEWRAVNPKLRHRKMIEECFISYFGYSKF